MKKIQIVLSLALATGLFSSQAQTTRINDNSLSNFEKTEIQLNISEQFENNAFINEYIFNQSTKANESTNKYGLCIVKSMNPLLSKATSSKNNNIQIYYKGKIKTIETK